MRSPPLTVGPWPITNVITRGILHEIDRLPLQRGDGLVIMPDGTKYTSSVAHGGISRISPDGSAELIARNIPSAASMCYDPGSNQLVVPMNPNNGLAFVELD